MRKFILFLSLLVIPLYALGYDAQAGGIYYNLNKSSKTAVVTYQKYDGNNWPYYSDYSGSVIIPKKITNSGVESVVTGIGECFLLLQRPDIRDHPQQRDKYQIQRFLLL